MSKLKEPHNKLEFLEELRSIAQLGLNYTKDPFDKERFQRLLELTSIKYSELSNTPVDRIIERFQKELGHVTPKVGVDAAIFNNDGKILLTKRTDDNLWCLPCGWTELNESPQESLKRELLEEVNLQSEVKSVIEIFTRLPGTYGQPHTSYHILYYCIALDNNLKNSEEVSEYGYFNHTQNIMWHKDHEIRAKLAYGYWNNTINNKTY